MKAYIEMVGQIISDATDNYPSPYGRHWKRSL